MGHRKKTAAYRFFYPQALLSSQEIPREKKHRSENGVVTHACNPVLGNLRRADVSSKLA